jgi:hypothetical protein
MHQVMMVVPIDADVNKTEHIAHEHRAYFQQFLKVSSCGTFISNTMIVMIIASTPSLNASNLPLPIDRNLFGCDTKIKLLGIRF